MFLKKTSAKRALMFKTRREARQSPFMFFYVSYSPFVDLTLDFGKIPVLPVLSALKINKHRVLTIFFVNLHSINCAKLNVT